MGNKSDSNENKKLIAYCGLLCTECPALLATKANDTEAIKKVAKEWTKAYNINVTPENVWCDGCIVDGKKCAHCSECEIRSCAQKLGVENCAKCDKYACEILDGFFKMVPMARETLDALRRA